MNFILLQAVTLTTFSIRSPYILHTFSDCWVDWCFWVALLFWSLDFLSLLLLRAAASTWCRARRFVVLPFVTSSLSIVWLSEVFFLQTWILPLPFWKCLPSWTDWWFWHFAALAHCKPCFWVNKYQYRTGSALSGLSTFLPPLCTPASWRKSSGFGIKFGNCTLTFSLT